MVLQSIGVGLKRRVWVIVGALVIFIASLFLVRVIPTEFSLMKITGDFQLL